MKKSWKVTFVFVAICGILLATAFFVGISGNRTGLLLCYLATVAVILAFMYNWRKVWKFLILLGASAVGFAVFVFLHNFFYALAKLSADIIVLNRLFEFLHVVSFLIAIFVCPAGFLVSAVGSAAMSFKIGLTSTRPSRKIAFVFLGIFCAALIVAFFVFIGIPCVI